MTIMQILFVILGGIFMPITTADAAQIFKLEPAQYYFSSKTHLLVTAAMTGNMSMAQQLVNEGANPNDEGPPESKYNRLRPLHYAIAANNRQAARILMAVGADPEMKTEGPGRPLMFAMRLDNMEMLSFLLDLKPIDSLAPDVLKSLVFGAVDIPRPRCLKLLLERGAPIDLEDGARSTILMAAMDAQDYDLAEWLLLKGASVNTEAGGEVTPAYAVEFYLKKFKPGSPTHNKVLHLKEMMKERGAVFPALSPAEIRAKRAQLKNQPGDER
ncbi:MAG TPA: hypothetical protein DCZ75_02380 [Geobacter sp.]|nr:hypothetical protein [Geobacter sp.]